MDHVRALDRSHPGIMATVNRPGFVEKRSPHAPKCNGHTSEASNESATLRCKKILVLAVALDLDAADLVRGLRPLEVGDPAASAEHTG